MNVRVGLSFYFPYALKKAWTYVLVNFTMLMVEVLCQVLCICTNICMRYIEILWTDERFRPNELGIISIPLKLNKSLPMVDHSD